ncbi:MAG TPA: asparagine synthase (glutamine-hydrolyzing) [Gaiellaceae bacterium]|nr:asparagine synthase (glutamine-hydrolyzing) [Gaiellaceae bacterium]
MCGIAGIYARPGTGAPEGLLLAMAGELRHRGPDGTGLYLDGRFGMANTRLAIVDLAGGDQPLPSEDGRYWVMQNGEVYNHVELRAELEALGRRFATTCDTEVIAQAYAEWGPACLERLNGDFALAVWDRWARELFLARDRFGVRPLFVAELDGDLVFASEAKALLRHPAARRELDPAGLVETFTTWCISPDGSAFPGIRELAPAHYLVAGPDGIREERRWWDLRFSAAGDVPPGERAALAEELDALLADATRIRLRADVPVAAYLSGGLDSSAIVAIALEQMEETLYSFGIGFADPRFDESEFQDRLARDQGTSLTRTVVSARDIAELLPRTIEMSEKPTLRTAPAPLLRLSRAVREAGLKVVTTGEGADELFAGYDLFRENKVRHFWAREPDSELRPLLLTRLNAFIGKDLKRSGAFLAGFYRKGLTETDDPLYSHRIRFANTARILALVEGDVLARAAERGDPAERLEARLPSWFGELTPLGRAQYLEITTFLNGYLLHSQGDRMLMGHSVEGRFPFLDYRVAEFAAALPDALRLRGLHEKYLLRKAVEHRLPPEIAARKKRPYRAPIVGAFVGPEAPEYVRELLAPDRLRAAGLFAPDAVARVVRKCEAGAPRDAVSETDEMALVGVLSTMLLHERFVASPRLAEPLVPDRVVVGTDVRVPGAHSAPGDTVSLGPKAVA